MPNCPSHRIYRTQCLGKVALLLAWGCLAALSVSAQTAAPPAPSPALTLVQSAILAMTGSSVPADVSMTGSVIWINGSRQQSGSATLKVKNTGESLLDVSVGSNRRVEVRNDSSGAPDGEWIGSDGVPHRMAPHNCLIPALWFAPHGPVSLMTRADATVTYIGTESRNGIRVDHLRAFRTFSRQTAKMTATLQRLSTFDVYLDPTSHLPLAITFNLHLDNDLNRDIPVEVRFADYRTVNGVLVPFRMQRLIQGGLDIDVTVNYAAVNTGLSDSDFALR